ncbi:ArgS-related anticodon-binding protein NrtL [Streptomyces sp. NPDC052309]|uniref:ArgS-related anticodon-binding protein NrtL n=1 Tax=Streptomyces sp. NPDC052309 TaxID=3155421 RepID=UPI0034173066
MTPAELSRTVLHAVRRAVDAGQLSVTPPERVVVTPPGPGGCGDYATNVALQLARPAGRTPLAVAEVLRPYLVGTDGITDVVVTGPGFLNFSLYDAAPVALVQEILRRGSRYGFVDGPRSGQAGQGRGGALIHCAHDVRAVVVMDAVARILRSQGVPVLTRCAGHPHPEWEHIFGAGVDSVGSSPTQGATVLRPVPAPADPLPLGRDAGRWALLHPAAHDRPLIGDEHLVQRESNPLFRVRYAHARSRALVRNAADLGFGPEPGPVTAAGAQSLLAALADHPRVLAAAARHHAPDRLARHLVTVADAALPLLPTVLPRGAEKPSAAHRARLALAEAAGTVLAGGLSLLGIDAPDHL